MHILIVMIAIANVFIEFCPIIKVKTIKRGLMSVMNYSRLAILKRNDVYYG